MTQEEAKGADWAGEELPAGWAWAMLDELATWTGGGTPDKGVPSYWEGEIPWISPKDMKSVRLADTQDHISQAAVDESAAKAFPENSIAMVVRSGILAHTLPVALVPFGATANQDMKVLTPLPGVNAEWLLYALLSAAPNIRERCRKHGTTVASIDFAQLRAYRLPLPPRTEQDRIVAAIDALLPQLAEGAKYLRQARELVAAQRDAFLTSALSGQWPTVTLGKLLREPLRNGHSAKAAKNGAGIRTLTLTAVTRGEFTNSNTKVTDAEPVRVKDLWLQPGDIFVERSNTAELVGTAALYRGEPGWSIFPDLLIRVRVIDAVLPEFVELVLKGRGARRHFQRAAQGIAGSMPKISQDTIRNLPVPLPGLEEQRRIVGRVEDEGTTLQLAEADMKHAAILEDDLRRAILRQAFRGRLI